ncbi:MAG: InlB B-repeat-containing protein [Paludibacteraceae bacterium]|nr:InlB B-repeat-containing protein [Paludibacteraceae bacterium]
MTKVGTNLLSDTAKRRQKDGNETATSDKVIIRTSLGHFLRYVAMIFAVLVMSVANIGMAWGATTAPSGLHNQSSLNYAATDTIQKGGKIYEIYWCNSNSSNVKTALSKKTYGSSNTEATGTDKWCNIGSSVGNTSASATAGTIDEFTWSTSHRYMRVRASNQSNYQVVMVVKGYEGVAVLHKANTDLQIVVERYNTATSAYVAYTPATSSTSKATNSHYKTYASLDKSDQFRITFQGSGTGSTNRDMLAFSLSVTASSCPATANAGADKSTTVGVGVAMAATAASSGYTGAWSIKAGSPSTATSQLSSTSSATATFTPTAAGTYTLVWTVTDNSDGTCSASDEATVTVSAPVVTHDITYTNLKGADNSANPTTYTEGVGVASFANLRHVVGYDFTGWSPSSISSSATTDQTIVAQWTARAAAAGTGTLTYALAFGSGTITTTSITRNNGALYDATNISTANTSFVSGGEAPGNGCSGKLATTSSKEGSNYVELTFKIADGYTFTPSGVSIRANAVSNNKTLEVELKDNAASPHTKSVTAELAAGSTSGGVTYNLDFSSSPVTLEGTVTLKIYVYGSSGATKGWRIGPSVIVNGTVASAAPSCTAPTSPSISPSNGWLYVPGEEITLTASASNTDASTTYTWYRGATLEAAKAAGAIQATKTSAQGGTTYTIASCAASDAYKYWCEISNGTGCEASTSYDIKLYTFFLYNNDNSNNSSHAFTYIDRTNKKLSVTFDVSNATYTYYFKVSDGLGTWYGKNSSTITSATNWCDGLNSSGANVGLTTTLAGSYTVDYYYESNNVVVTYPVPNQTAGQTVYFDNTLTQMSNMYIRIGSTSYSSASSAFTAVPGTAALYQGSTIAWDGFAAWSIADNTGWTGENSIYQPWNGQWTGTGNDYQMSKQTDYQNYAVSGAVTIVPTALHNSEYNCQYYNVDKYNGLLRDRVTITAPVNGTITVNYTSEEGVASSFSATTVDMNQDLAHTVIITPTATPAEGYTLSGLTVNGAAHTSGNTYTVTANTTIAATFSPASYTVTLNTNDGTINAGNVTSYTYGTGATLPTNVTKSGFTFGGWYDNSGLTGSAVTTISTTATGNKEYWAKWTAAASLTALECNTRYTVQDMTAGGCGTLSTTSCYSAGLSANNRFEVLGDPSKTDQAGGTPEQKTNSKQTINSIDFTSFMYLKGDGLNGSTEPTCRGVKFIIPSAGKLTIYYRYGDRSKLKKEGEDAVNVGATTGGYGYDTHDVTAGTYYIYGASSGAVLIAVEYQCCTTPAAPTAFANTAVTSTTATFSITDAADAASYDLYYASGSPSTPTAGTNATENVTTKTPTITGLTASTTYKIWVRSVCDADHKSAWVALGTTSFTTSAAEPTALVTWQMKVDQAAWALKSGTTEDGTNITSIASTADEPGSTSTGITGTTGKVVMASGESNVDKAASFTFTVNSAKKVVPEKVTCKVLNVSSGNRTYKAQLSDNNGHVYYSTNTVSVTTENVLTDATFNFASSLVLTGNVTLKVYAWKTSGSPTQFRMGEYVKLFGEVQNAADYTVTHTLSNVTKSSGATSVKEGNNYTATYAGAGGYALPSTITVTIGGSPATAGTDYTWTQGTGVVSIPGNKVTGNIVITVTGDEPAVTHNVTFSLTNVVYSSGDNQGTGAATEGSAFSTVFAASSGYSLPGTITVTIGGVEQTAGTGYTWAQGSGTLTIPAAYVTGDIVVTIVGEEMEGDGCDELVHTEAATATTLNTTVGTATLSSPSGQTANDKAIKLNSSGYIELSPKAGKSFAAGDSLIIVMWNQASSAKTTGYRIAGTDYTASMPSKVNTTFRRKLIAADIVSSKVKIERESANGSNAYFVSAIIKHCEDLPSCTTPTLPTLSNQTVCPGSDIAAWDATPTNIATITGASEDVAYSWKKKGSDTELAATASFDLGSSATEGMAGTYVVTVTVSKTGYISKSASAEVDLTVTPATETPSITASKAKVYVTDEVTLTATCGSTGVTWNWYLCANADGTGAGSSLGTSATYTIASAPAAGTYYYKAVATGDGTHSCGTAEYVYTLVVSTADACDKEFWFAKEGDRPTGAAAATHITGCPSGSSSASYTASIDGTNYTLTGSTGQKTGNVTIVVPADNTGTLYVVVQGSSSRTITLSKGGTQIGQETPANSTWGVFTFDNLDAGTYTLVSSGNISWGIIALKLCPTVACTDDTPTAAATNATVCVGGSITITATGYEAGATFQWQKQNATTSVWENIDGATSDTYTVAPAAAEHAGNYHIVATKNCARTSNTVTIAVPSAPVFNSFTTTRRVMETQALSISDVSATDAVSYTWYKSADATWDAGDTEIGTSKNLLKPYDGETAGSTYYVFCRATNSCGATTSSAITVTVQTLVEEDCAIVGNSGEHNTFAKTGNVSSGTYGSIAELHTNSNNKYIYYTAESGYYFATATVNACVGNASDLPTAAYSYSTDGGANWTDQNLTGMTTAYADHVINLPANVNAFRVGRRLGDCGISSSTIYIHQVCFTYNENCTKTTVDPSSASVTHEIGDSFTEPTFTVKSSGVALSPQPTITYTSSDETVATVDDDGTVNFQDKAGTVVITAAYAGDATYCESEGSYTITVSCSDEAPRIIAAEGTNLGGCNDNITLEAKKQDGTTNFSDGTYQWYRDGEAISGATSRTYTVSLTGVYSVEHISVGGCVSPSSNKATVTSESAEPEVERLTPFQYYHVDKVYAETSIMRFRHLFAVKNAGTTLEGKHFKMELSRNGGSPTDVTTSNAFVMSADTVLLDMNKLYNKYALNDELVLTCSAVDCEGNVSSIYKNTITIYVIDETPTLALICSGADGDGTRDTKKLVVGGDFLTGYNKADLCVQTGKTSFDKTQEWVLYTRLKENYIVTPVNGYAEFNKLNYEPFDILFLTDYPKASKSDAAATILDDMADLCDYRPLFTFKTHMVHKSPSKWAAKGFMAQPEVPKQSRLRLNIVCYAHPMFDDLKEVSDQIQKDASDHSQIVYTMLTGPGHESSKGMQGFPIDAAEGFVTIGLVHYDATAADDTPSEGYVTWTPESDDVMLVAAAERQVNLEARMILFSINCGAQSKLTETGRQVVLRSLEYLLSDATITPVADCSFTFTNGAGNDWTYEQYKAKCPACTGTIGDGKWSTAGNWGPDWILQPGKDTEVKIAAPVTVDMPHAKVRTVRILEGGSIDIPAGSGLEVGSTIRRLDGTEISPTEENDIHIGSASTGNGTLIFNNNFGDTKARVDMYSNAKADVANMSATTSTWQYIGTPHTDVASATRNYYDSWLYQYSGSGWEVIPNGGPLVPFRGYCVTHPAAPVVFDMVGTLVATTTQDIAIPAGYTVIANSWVAPIDINAITDDDMEGISDKSIYFFNTGTDADGTAGTGTEAGTYRTTPIHSASYTGDWQIPSMQGFYISTESDGTLHLDYDRHVRPTGSRSVVSNPMYAPRRAAAESDEPNVLKIFARGSRYQDKLVVLEREDFTRGYDSGWDGEAWGGGTLSPMVYVTGEGREDAVSAIPEFEGTVIAFKAGEDSEYRFEFVYSEDAEPLYLFDTENNTYTQIMTGNAYYFTTSDKSPHSRFILTRKNPQVATGVEPTSDSSLKGRAKKLLIEDKMFIMVNGMLYDATGKVVK